MARKRKKKRVGMLPKLILFTFVVYSVVTLVSLQVKINAQRAALTALAGDIDTEKQKQTELRQLLDAELTDEYMASEAQKHGYAASNERVFIETSGH